MGEDDALDAELERVGAELKAFLPRGVAIDDDTAIHPSEKTRRLLIEWRERAARRQAAHGRMALLMGAVHYAIGLPVAIMAAVSGGSVLVSPDNATVAPWVGFLGLAAAALAAIQTFVSAQGRSEAHRISAARFAAVKRELEQVLAHMPEPRKLRAAMSALRKTMDDAQNQAPHVALAPIQLKNPYISETAYAQRR